LHEAGFDDFDKQRMRILWPHLRRAVQTHWLLQRARELPRAAGAALDALPLPAWVLRADATMEYANAAARALEPSAIWRSDHRQRLSSLGDLDAAAIAETARRAPAGAARVLALGGKSGPLRAILRTAPVGEVALYVSAWPRAQVLFILEMPFAQTEQQWLKDLCTRLHLTPAESRVLEQLAAGMTADQIAATQSVNVTTVRTHLRALFAKTGRNRQSDLVRLALGR
jgi:DNA-binding CsgD family transcriptional regulator